MKLGVDEARARFTRVPVARLATADGAGRPHVVVTIFVAAHDWIFTADDGKPKQRRNVKRHRNIKINTGVTRS